MFSKKKEIKKIKGFFKFLNRFILIMTAADFLLFSSLGLIGPILAVYLTKQIEGGNLEVIGFGSMVYFLVSSIFKMPVAKIIDKNLAEYDDFYVTFAGYILMSLVPFLLILISKPIHLYLVQALNGFGTAIAYPGWMALFSRHLNKGHEGTGWGFFATSTNIGSAIAAALGGILAQRFGFYNLLIIAGILSFLGSFCMLLNKKNIIISGYVAKVERVGAKLDKKME